MSLQKVGTCIPAHRALKPTRLQSAKRYCTDSVSNVSRRDDFSDAGVQRAVL